MSKIRNKAIYLLPILTLFDSYYLFKLSNFYVTFSVIGLVIVLLLSLFSLKFEKRDLYYLFTILLLLCIAFITNNNSSLTSFFLYIFMFFTFIFSKHKSDINQMDQWIKRFTIFINIFALIAVIQFISNFTNIEFFDIIIDGHMVEGFNRGNYIHIGNLTLMRAHSLYLEPSSLSQYSSFAIISAFYLYKNRVIKKTFLFVTVALSIIATIFSVSGTGPLMLLIVSIVYLVNKFRHRQQELRAQDYWIIIGILVAIFAFILLPKNLKEYLFVRVSEISNPELSGGMRFTFPYLVMFNSWKLNFFGVGSGNEAYAINQYFTNGESVQEVLSSGYAKMGVELGILGLIFLFTLIYQCKNKRYYYFFIILLTYNFIGGNLLNSHFWCFMCFFNIISSKNVCSKNTNKIGYKYLLQKS